MMTTTTRVLFSTAIAVLLALPPRAHGGDMGQYLRDLAGDNEKARALARQMLPRESMGAVPPVLELFKSDDTRVWKAARTVLFDIVHQVGVPGRESEREELTDRVLAFVTSEETPERARREGLALVALVTPEDYGLRKLRDMARSDRYREATLACLEELATEEAREELAWLVRHTSGAAKADAIESVRVLTPGHEEAVAERLLRSQDIDARVAAMKALAQTGQPRLIRIYQMALDGLTGRHLDDALDAYLRLGEAIFERYGEQESLRGMYQHLLLIEDRVGFRGAAMAGLAQLNDGAAVSAIFNAVAAEPTRDLQAPALMALGDVSGQDAYNALMAGYATCDEEMRLSLLPLFGRTRDRYFLQTLLDESASPNAARAAAAFEGLVLAEFPEGADAAAAYALSKKDAEAPVTTMRLIRRLAQAYRAQGHADAAGKAYYAYYHVAREDLDKQIALQGMKDFPTPEGEGIVAEASPEG